MLRRCPIYSRDCLCLSRSSSFVSHRGPHHQIKYVLYFVVCWMTYVVLLSFEFFTKIKLLSLQPHQPLPHLVGLLPKHKTTTGHITSILYQLYHQNHETWCVQLWRTWVCPRSDDQCLEPSCGRPGSSSSSPSQFVSWLLFCCHPVLVIEQKDT